MAWLAQVFSRRRRYEDISISIQEHIDERADEPAALAAAAALASYLPARRGAGVNPVEALRAE